MITSQVGLRSGGSTPIPSRRRCFCKLAFQALTRPMLRALREHMIEVDHDSVVHLPDPTREQRHFPRACYLANVSVIDEQVGELMSTLVSLFDLGPTMLDLEGAHAEPDMEAASVYSTSRTNQGAPGELRSRSYL